MKYFYFFCLSFLLAGCNLGSPESCTDGIEVTLVDFTGLDGCQWIFTSEIVDFQMEPTNLADFESDPVSGRVYEMSFVERPDIASICLVGKIVEITCLE